MASARAPTAPVAACGGGGSAPFGGQARVATVAPGPAAEAADQPPEASGFLPGTAGPGGTPSSATHETAGGSLLGRRAQDHRAGAVAAAFPRLLVTFTVIHSLLSLGVFSMFIWLLVAFAQEHDRPCDVPLKAWAVVDFCFTSYHALHGAMLHLAYGGGRRGGDGPRRLPRWERWHLASVTLFDFIWLGIGLHWIRGAGTCAETAPALYRACAAYATSSLVGGIFMCVNLVGLYTIVTHLLATGVLSAPQEAAPSGTLESLPVVAFDPGADLFQRCPDCSICLSAFSPAAQVRVAPCGHAFDSACIAGWLKLGRTCPLCRADLCTGRAPPTEAGDGRRGIAVTAAVAAVVGARVAGGDDAA